MALIDLLYRAEKGSRLTPTEMDANLQALQDGVNATLVAAPAYVTGRYYRPALAYNVSNAVLSTGSTWFAPFFVSDPVTFTKIGARLITGAAGGLLRLGVWKDNGSGAPGTLVVDSGTLTCETASNNTDREATALSIVLTRGWYWLGWESNMDLTVQWFSCLHSDATGGSTSNAVVGEVIYGAHTFGAFASSPTAGSIFAGGVIPGVWLRN
jgi:hypothetical protein